MNEAWLLSCGFEKCCGFENCCICQNCVNEFLLYLPGSILISEILKKNLREGILEVMKGCEAFNSCEFSTLVLYLLLLESCRENVSQSKVAEDK